MMNLVKTTMLLALMTALFMGLGYLLAGQTGMFIAFFMAAAMNLFSWWNSGKMVLRMHGAREVDEESSPVLINMVKGLAENAGIPMPRVYVLETDQPNAFATGRSPEHAAVAASAGLLDALNEEEVAAVMAHELAHIRSRDTLTMTITATFAGAIGMLANFAFFFRGGNNNGLGMIGTLIAMFVAPMAAGLVQMAISRTREYEADRDGAEICGNPLALASALKKIAAMTGQITNEHAEHAPATAHVFIINPLNGSGMDGLFSTHPAVGNRVAALEALYEEWREKGLLNNRRPEAEIAPEHAPVPRAEAKPKPRRRDSHTTSWRDPLPVENDDEASDSIGPWGRSKAADKKGPWG